MKTTLTALVVMMFVLTGLRGADTPEVNRARANGAKGKITFRVVDSQNNLVTGADVMLGFWNLNQKNDGVDGKTDAAGLFTATGTPMNEVNYSIQKAGYYKTEGRYVFYRANDPTAVKDGRWQPWNPTNTVVLKEIRHPVPMFAKQLEIVIPVWEEPVGFDLEKGDLVAPYGKGIIPDVYVTYSASQKDVFNYTNQIIFTFSNRLDGFIRMQKDSWSEFKSTYEAPTNGYQSELVFRRGEWGGGTTYKELKNESITDSEYLIFRVRTIVDEKGNIVNARYGKLYAVDFGRFDSKGKTGGFSCSSYFDPDGTRNLEFNTKSNLFLMPIIEKINEFRKQARVNGQNNSNVDENAYFQIYKERDDLQRLIGYPPP